MKKFTRLFSTVLFTANMISSFAGNHIQVIIPGDHSPKSFKMPSNIKVEDYLANTVIFKVKPQYRQNCKAHSVDNLLPLQDFLQNAGSWGVAKIFPRHTAPERERNALGQKTTDLSTIYSFKYNSALSLEKVINSMLSLGYFEYVQPWYVPGTMLNPNDPSWTAGQYHLQGAVAGSINTLNAWDITQGDTSVVIGIVDTGTQLDHPDLQANIKLNYADPVDGIDNDGDGYIDNYQGWDTGMNDNDPTWEGNPHGVATSGDACAVTNNSVGVASPGFNCKFLPVKGASSSGSLTAVYPGIVYAADHGAKIISNSWGGPGGGPYGQDIINYAAINKNCLVLASAGNNGTEEQFYPSSYNYVFRVASSTGTDAMSGFSSYGLDVDYTAPGSNINSTISGSGYGTMSGTSMACPISAGAAGLIQSYFNYTNAFQIGERLKQTCDPMPASSQYMAGKLGKGRINVGTALSAAAAKSILINPVTITDGNDNIFMPGESLSISGIFTNYLDPSSASAVATLSVIAGGTYATVTQGSFAVGALAMLGAINNTGSPFTVDVLGTAPFNQVIKFKINITDNAFTGDQYFEVVVNPDYINININDVHTSITSKGRIGYNLDGQQQGIGFQYQLASPADMLYEMSLIIGVSSAKVSDMFRDGNTGNVDFGSINRVYKVNPSVISDFDADGTFNDAPATVPVPVEVHHNAYAWSTAPYRKFILVKYSIKNTDTAALQNMYAGIIADWDIPNSDPGKNKAAYDSTYRMGYTWNTTTNGPYAAIKLLSNTAPVVHYALDNVGGGGGGVDPAADFTSAEKYTVLSTNRATAGNASPTGADVMTCVSSGPFTINPGDSVEVAFALIGGDNIPDIQASACAAQAKYDNGCANPGVNDPENENFWIYNFPNPATNTVNIHYNSVGYKNAEIRIVNSLGEVIMASENLAQGESTLTVDVSKLSSGAYFYQLSASDGKAGETRITKKLTIIR